MIVILLWHCREAAIERVGPGSENPLNEAYDKH